MKCKDAKKEMVNLYFQLVNKGEQLEIEQHIESCRSCSQEYQLLMQSISLLTPNVRLGVDKGLKQKIIEQLQNQERQMETISLTKQSQAKYGFINFKRWIAVAAALILLLGILPLITNNSNNCTTQSCMAQILINNSISALEGVKTMYIKFLVRTLPNDNFEYIDVNQEFMPHQLWKDFSHPAKWRIEKPERLVIDNGKESFLISKSVDSIAITGLTNNGFVEFLKILLEPESLFRKEIDESKKDKSTYSISEAGTEKILTIESKAKGDFSKSDIGKNASIIESDNKRIYIFDKPTGLLKSMKVFIYMDKKEIEVLKIQSIEYDKPLDGSLFMLPEGFKRTKVEIFPDKKLSELAPEEVARKFFEDCQNNKWDEVKKLYPYPSFPLIMEELKNMQLISIGKAFKSGLYRGYKVPYEIKLGDGKLKKWNLAVRNDNEQQVWLVDGGI